MDQTPHCAICHRPIAHNAQSISVKQRGISSFIKKSKLVGDNKWMEWMDKDEFQCHDTCRKHYASSGRVPTEIVTNVADNVSSPACDDVSDFDFNKNCLFCEKNFCHVAKRDISFVEDDKLRDRLIEMEKKRNETFNENFVRRLESVSSLTRLKAGYHKKCFSSFTVLLKETNEDRMLSKYSSELAPVWEFLEKDKSAAHTLSNIMNIIGTDELDRRTVKKAIERKYGEEIDCCTFEGKDVKVFFKSHHAFNVSAGSKALTDGQKDVILRAASEILRDDIFNEPFDKENYPPAHQFLQNVSSVQPPYLKSFLQYFLSVEEQEDRSTEDVKRDFIAHSILSFLRPRKFISTLHLSIGTFIHRKTGSRLIVDLLHKLGCCVSYKEVALYEASTIMNPPKVVVDDAFVQYVFDNTDHNVRTLDGRDTFHCLGGIAIHTPESNVSHERGIVRLKEMPNADVLAAQKQIPIMLYLEPAGSGLRKIEFVSTDSLPMDEVSLYSPTFSTYLWLKCVDLTGTPTWRGFMEECSEGFTYDTSAITCQQFINEPPSNLTTIYTSLKHAMKETSECGQKTTVLTFDLPLFMKCRDIVAAKGLTNVVVRLGGFHTLMSFLGAIGSIMGGSGLSDLWTLGYAADSIKKMIDGHSFARALRAHILTFTALGIIVCETTEEKESLKQTTRLFLDKCKENKHQLGDSEIDKDLQHLSKCFYAKLNELKHNGPTAKLWVQYFEAVLVALRFIQAERLGDWKLHLDCVRRMLPFFHASGHFSYAKAAQIYLQDMVELETAMDPDDYDKFTNRGFFTIHRSDKAWSGIWSDMTIEQTLNRYFGTDLKHGRGVTPSVVSRYVLGMPCAFELMNGLEEFCNLETRNSEQHIDLTTGRKLRDAKDIDAFVGWLKNHEPFAVRKELMSLSTGIIGGVDIKCHLAVEQGKISMSTMIGKTADKVSLTKLYFVKNLEIAKKGTKLVGLHSTPVDSHYIFQQFSISFEGNENDRRKCFDYELSTCPLSLFDDKGFMRKTNKAELYKLFSITKPSADFFEQCFFILDGGWLLHSVVWPHSKTFRAIFEIYSSSVYRRFGRNCAIVFDGYGNESIGVKSYERYRRQETNCAADIQIQTSNFLTLTQRQLLCNVANKAQFVSHLMNHLKQCGFAVYQAVEDADAKIVRTALNTKRGLLPDARSSAVVVVGTDVDLLILLIALTSKSENMYFYKMGQGKRDNVLYATFDHRHLQPFLLFAHAFAGCDSTSAFYNKGKKKLINMLQKNPEMQSLTQLFYEQNCSADELLQNAEKITQKLYADKSAASTLGHLRYELFRTSLATSKKEISLAGLPPTTSALLEHTKRVYYQIQVWLKHELDPCFWGWERREKMLLPIMTKADPAPKSLLNKINCQCKTKCLSQNCTCRKVGVKCNPLCKFCTAESCNNRQRLESALTVEGCSNEVDNVVPEEDNDVPEEDDYLSECEQHELAATDETDNEEPMDDDF